MGFAAGPLFSARRCSGRPTTIACSPAPAPSSPAGQPNHAAPTSLRGRRVECRRPRCACRLTARAQPPVKARRLPGTARNRGLRAREPAHQVGARVGSFAPSLPRRRLRPPVGACRRKTHTRLRLGGPVRSAPAHPAVACGGGLLGAACRGSASVWLRGGGARFVGLLLRSSSAQRLALVLRAARPSAPPRGGSVARWCVGCIWRAGCGRVWWSDLGRPGGGGLGVGGLGAAAVGDGH